MAEINWSEIIAFILRLIADGLDKNEAIARASKRFGVSVSGIKSRM